MIIETVRNEEAAFDRLREMGIGSTASMVPDVSSTTGGYLVIYEVNL